MKKNQMNLPLIANLADPSSINTRTLDKGSRDTTLMTTTGVSRPSVNKKR